MLVTGATLGQDMRFYLEKVENAQSLVTKIWNAARFVVMNTQELTDITLPDDDQLDVADRYILHKLYTTTQALTEQFEAYEFAEAGKTIYEFFWNDFCDWYIELSKVHLYGEEPIKKEATQRVLSYVLDQALRLLHPIMPFVTEEIWQVLPHEGETIMLAAWPAIPQKYENEIAQDEMYVLIEIIRSLRTLRHENNLALSKPVPILLKVHPQKLSIVREGAHYITRLCNPSSLVIDVDFEVPAVRKVAVLTDIEVMISMEGMIDIDAERDRLTKEKETLDFEVTRLEQKLGNASFVDRAPKAIVDKEKEKLDDYRLRREKVLALLAEL